MLFVARIASALTLVLALLGLPVASVLCDTICPPARADHPRVATTPLRLRSARTAVACHGAQGDATSAAPRATDRSGERASTWAPHGDTQHACDHPALAAAPSAGVRLVPAPALAAFQMAAVPPPVARVWRAAVSAGPVHRARLTGAFSPVLRI